MFYIVRTHSHGRTLYLGTWLKLLDLGQFLCALFQENWRLKNQIQFQKGSGNIIEKQNTIF